MLPLAYTHMMYALIFWFSFVACALSEVLGPAGWRHRVKTTKLDRGSLLILNTSALLGLILCFVFPLVLPVTTIVWNQPVFFMSGLVLLCLGMGLRKYAMVVLGQSFVGVVLVRSDQPVVQNGPYRYIRHPAYAGILLASLGVGLMMTNWGSLLALVTSLFAGLFYRIKVEEEALQQTLGRAYWDYTRRTKNRLIPHIF